MVDNNDHTNQTKNHPKHVVSPPPRRRGKGRKPQSAPIIPDNPSNVDPKASQELQKGKKKGNNGKHGPKPKFDDPVEFQKKVDAYFAECDQIKPVTVLTKRGEVVDIPKSKPYTVEGLSLALGFIDVKHLWDYAKERRGKSALIAEIISRAKRKVFESWFIGALDGGYNDRIASLGLQAWGGYQIKQQIELTGDMLSAAKSPEEAKILTKLGEELAAWKAARAKAEEQEPVPVTPDPEPDQQEIRH